MKRKHWLKSKINWAAIILILQSLITLVQQQPTTMTWQSWLTLVLGVLIIVFRTYYTTSAIKAKRVKRV